MDLRTALMQTKERLPERPLAVYFEDVSIAKTAKEQAVAPREIFDYNDVQTIIEKPTNELFDRTVIAFQFQTMCRPSEMWALDWADLDLAGATVHFDKVVRRTATGMKVQGRLKNDHKKEAHEQGKTVPLSSFLVSLLRELQVDPRRSGPVFRTSQGSRINKDNFKARVWPAMKARLGLPADCPVFYTLKHAGNSYLDDVGVPAKVRATLMGHKDERMAMRVYNRTRVESVLAAVAAFEPKRPSSVSKPAEGKQGGEAASGLSEKPFVYKGFGHESPPLDTVEVIGSKPIVPTIEARRDGLFHA
jgi:integrase